jgi:hypothetical protein
VSIPRIPRTLGLAIGLRTQTLRHATRGDIVGQGDVVEGPGAFYRVTGYTPPTRYNKQGLVYAERLDHLPALTTAQAEVQRSPGLQRALSQDRATFIATSTHPPTVAGPLWDWWRGITHAP